MKGKIITRHFLLCGNCEKEVDLETTNKPVANLKVKELGYRIRRPYGFICPECDVLLDQKWEDSIKKTADEVYAKMSPEQRANIHTHAVRLGISQERRSPLDVMIDRACGLE